MDIGGPEKLESALLRQTLARHAGACPDPAILAAYYEGSLDPEEAAGFEKHLAACALCREQIAAMVRADDSLAGGPPGQAASEWSWLWNWRWLAPVAAVLAIAIFWAARRPAAKLPEQQPLVAMSPPETPASRSLGQLPAIERISPGSSPTASPVSPKANEGPLAPHDAVSQGDLKEQNAAPRDVQRKVAESENSSQQTPETASPAAGSPSQVAGEQSAGGIIGGAVGAASDGSSGAAKQQQQMVLVRPGLMSRYSTDERASPEAADQRGFEIHSPDPAVLWRAASGGYIARSTDGGATWQAQQPLVHVRLLAGAAVSPSICWVAGRDGVILLTKDGANWTKIPPPAHADFVDISARDASSATVTTADGRKFLTQNEGKDWQLAQ